jgi:hypothetical protein
MSFAAELKAARLTARLDGHASLESCLNDYDVWGKTVGEVAEILINDDEQNP